MSKNTKRGNRRRIAKMKAQMRAIVGILKRSGVKVGTGPIVRRSTGRVI